VLLRRSEGESPRTWASSTNDDASSWRCTDGRGTEPDWLYDTMIYEALMDLALAQSRKKNSAELSFHCSGRVHSADGILKQTRGKRRKEEDEEKINQAKARPAASDSTWGTGYVQVSPCWAKVSNMCCAGSFGKRDDGYI
jgi:hypothetical protein